MILLQNIMMNKLSLVLEYILLMEEITVVISSFSLKMMKVSSKLVFDYKHLNAFPVKYLWSSCAKLLFSSAMIYQIDFCCG